MPASDNKIDEIILSLTELRSELRSEFERIRGKLQHINRILENHAEITRTNGVSLDLVLANQTDHARSIRLLQQDVRELRNEVMAIAAAEPPGK